ncbi:hypothetical protein DPMN_095586 [Dreissena polymorpha]|uniref:Uncharacterized protein n=1 Tax=Dreissena polymorpha TaxID=45954 RepID=A0A9D4IZU0_DREPO|nr:hypothetical protein DPMN_168627 [Dreissena polymorpha]KAH3853063.1 hypothetical protein DPMN_095586 [Dreissena polymorpha]
MSMSHAPVTLQALMFYSLLKIARRSQQIIAQNATWIAPLHTPTVPTTGYRISCTSSIQPKIFHNL